jgi:hypothetical protein
MYWTDWVMQPSVPGRKAKIETAKMDGSDRQVLTDNHTQWPNSLFLDKVGRRLYWTEAYYDIIQSINLDGSDTKVRIIFVSAVAVFLKPHEKVSFIKLSFHKEK